MPIWSIRKVMDQIGHLEMLSRTVVDGLLAGKASIDHQGRMLRVRPAPSICAPGDEIRQIDWQVYARNDRYFIRQFEEENQFACDAGD